MTERAKLVERLKEIRERAIANGLVLRSCDEILQEIRTSRCGCDEGCPECTEGVTDD